MDPSRDLELPNPKRIKVVADNKDEVIGGASASESTGTISELLAGMSMNKHLAIHGCKFCGPHANCTLAHEKGYVYDPAVYGTEKNFDKMVREDQKEQFKDHNPEQVIAEMEKERLEEKAARQWASEKVGPFCCGNLKHVPRSDSAHLDEDKHEAIMTFAKHVVDGKGLGWINGSGVDKAEPYTDEQLKAIENVIRISRVGDDDNKATWIFHPTADPDDGADCYIMIHKVEGGIAFESTGPNGYLGFWCPEHKKKFRIGYSYKNMLGKKKTIASFMDDRLDKILKVGKMKPLVLGYGGPGW
ncbi:uncharacterized protein RSE6_03811 [Rhynchosporium secalis]|uniref:Uncharacterized protein n=1 Tax=Rhynchosporium secalis TaxID=38038 RepID=A0A1E1M3R2_RHYSE|nr:uncharacterized protein RSE6_03811 [Rhynchosporium secalis]